MTFSATSKICSGLQNRSLWPVGGRCFVPMGHAYAAADGDIKPASRPFAMMAIKPRSCEKRPRRWTAERQCDFEFSRQVGRTVQRLDLLYRVSPPLFLIEPDFMVGSGFEAGFAQFFAHHTLRRESGLARIDVAHHIPVDIAACGNRIEQRFVNRLIVSFTFHFRTPWI